MSVVIKCFFLFVRKVLFVDNHGSHVYNTDMLEDMTKNKVRLISTGTGIIFIVPSLVE